MKKSMPTNINRYRRPRPCVNSEIVCRVDARADLVSLEAHCRRCGSRVVLACNTHAGVLAWIESIKRDMEIEVYELLSGTQKRKAITEAEGICSSRG